LKKEEVEKLVSLRQLLVEKFSKLRDYKSNTNAIMKEFDHAQILHKTIVEIDGLLKDYVSFSDKK
jgi:hypothetical protein